VAVTFVMAPVRTAQQSLGACSRCDEDAPAHQTLPRKGYTRKMPGHQPPQNTVKPMLCARSCGVGKGHQQTMAACQMRSRKDSQPKCLPNRLAAV